jgi:predicted ATP-grasp superfamily ATP-dependent carboligase
VHDALRLRIEHENNNKKIIQKVAPNPQMSRFFSDAQNPPAVILSHGSGGLGAVRSLARQGIESIVIAYEESDVTLLSRYPSSKTVLRGDTDREKEEHALRILRELPVDSAVILTNSDRMVAVIARERELLRNKYHYALPTREIVDALNDKLQETRLVSSLGFSVPKTMQDLPADPASLAQDLRMPIIFKPHSYLASNLFPLKNAIVRDFEELVTFYRRWEPAISVLLAQEVIPGPDSNSWICSCTFDENHDLLDCGVKQKLRAFPAHFGGSTFAVSAINEQVVELTRQLGKKLGYVGHAGIEFRWDERDQCYKYIEVNPRLPANVGFDEASGLPTVMNSYHVSLGNEVQKSKAPQRNGVYFLDMMDDLRSARADGVPAWRIAAEYCRLLFMPTNGLHFAWDDPMPGLVVGGRILKAAAGSVFRTASKKIVTSKGSYQHG